jgi:hypothetical protein
MKLTSAKEFADACAFDAQVRMATGTCGKSYLHRSLRPLADVDFNERQDGFDLEDAHYCAGGCGL